MFLAFAPIGKIISYIFKQKGSFIMSFIPKLRFKAILTVASVVLSTNRRICSIAELKPY